MKTILELTNEKLKQLRAENKYGTKEYYDLVILREKMN